MEIALTYPDVTLAGGVERSLVECANELVHGGHGVHVFGSHWQPGVLRPEVQRHHLPIRRRPDALAAVQYRRRATEALRSHGPIAHGAFSALSPLGGVFWVPSVHRVAYELALRHRGAAGGLVQRANPYHRLRLRLEREILSPGGYSHLLAAADQVKVDVVERYGVPEADVTVQPLGFDPRAFSPARRRGHRAEARAELGYRDEDRVVVFVANELERKGFDCLLEAAAQVDDLQVLVVGRVDIAPYAERIERLGVRVKAVGSVSDVVAYHAAADVFALPTRYEPWGLVVVEALAAGLPVVTSRLAGSSVTVRDGETGVLLGDPDDAEELADGLRRMLAAPADDTAISASVAPYSWPEVARRYAAVLSEHSG